MQFRRFDQLRPDWMRAPRCGSLGLETLNPTLFSFMALADRPASIQHEGEYLIPLGLIEVGGLGAVMMLFGVVEWGGCDCRDPHQTSITRLSVGGALPKLQRPRPEE
jgi:hypothetical protein